MTMQHRFVKVTSLYPKKDYEVEVHFDDGTVKAIDFEPVLIGPFWGELKDRNLFSQMYLDAEVGTIAWPNGADFDPDTLYRWEEVVSALRNQLISA